MNLASLHGGRSLENTVTVPLTIFIQVGWLQWVLVLVGASLSGAVLFTTVS